jgi:chromosome segregation ATPase
MERGIDLNLSEGEVRYRVQEIFDSAKKTEELKKQVDKLSTRLEEAEGEVSRLNTASANDIAKIKQLQTEVDELNRKVTNRDTQISSLQTQLADLQSQISPDKVVVLTREEYARLSATKTLDKFTGWELLKEFLKRLAVKNNG